MKIPKVLFQTSLLKPPDYLIERIKTKCLGWEYKHFLDEDIIEFIKENPITDLNNSLEIFHSLKLGAHKADFFRYYYLYINGGVFMDSDAVLEKELDFIVKDYEFFTVQSYIKNNSMFNGFIGTIPKNPIIFQALKHIHVENIENINNDYFLICKELYTIIENYNKITDFIESQKGEKEIINKNKIFIEEIVNDQIAVSKDNDEIILTHYYNKNFYIPSLKPIKPKKIKKKTPIKMGITLDLPNETVHFFSNGIRQNVLYLGELFLNMGYELSFIVMDKNIKLCPEKELKKIFYREDFKITKYSEILSSNFDIVIVLGYEIILPVLKILKHMNTKIVYYACGNSYFIDSEKILYNQHKSLIDFPYTKDIKIYDQIWSIPQMFHVNKSYFETLYRSECIEVPFVWSSKSITMAALSYGIEDENDLLYKNKEENKKIVIFEPNLSIMKWCFPALLICENAYRKNENKDMIDKVFLNNITDHNNSINEFNLESLNKIVKSLDLFHDKKISIESRFNTLYFMKNYADIAVSHQMNNPLNYLYLDLAWMGWPIIHNAHLCKDVGYYYEDFNYEMGSKIVNEVIVTHELKKDEYLSNNRKIINRYLPSNSELQKKYKKLIEKLFN